jgi:SHAQKYF class myb-like DNA-binding protein
MEHCRFLEALKLFGKNWKKVQQHVQSRTSTQARSHAQKFFVKLDRKHVDL